MKSKVQIFYLCYGAFNNVIRAKESTRQSHDNYRSSEATGEYFYCFSKKNSLLFDERPFNLDLKSEIEMK